MQKIFMIVSILLSAIGMRSTAEAIEVSGNRLVSDLQSVGLSIDEIKQLDALSKIDPGQFQKAVEQDLRIKGKLRIEVLATANKGGGPCVYSSQ
jgi:hypothetical protein